MSSRRISEQDLAYPVLWLLKDGYRVLRSPVLLRLPKMGILVERHGLAHRVIAVEHPLIRDVRLVAPRERRHLFDTPVTFICEGEPWTMTVDDALRRIAWIVSACGQFESPSGFGLSANLATATSMWELLEMLPARM